MLGGSDSGGTGSGSGGFVPTFMVANERFEIPDFRQVPMFWPIVGSAGSVISGGEGSVLGSVS